MKSCEGCKYLDEVVIGRVNFCKLTKWLWVGKGKERPYHCKRRGKDEE